MRAKETSEDYRYFPEPDLPPLHVDAAWLEGIRAALPELPAARRGRYVGARPVPYDAAVLVADPALTAAFEADSRRRSGPAREGGREPRDRGLRAGGEGDGAPPRGWARGPGAGAELAALVRGVVAGDCRDRTRRRSWPSTSSDGTAVGAIVERRGLRQISDEAALARIVDEVVAANPAAVADIRAGKPQVAGFLVGPGDEGDEGPGERRPRPGGRPRAARSGGGGGAGGADQRRAVGRGAGARGDRLPARTRAVGAATRRSRRRTRTSRATRRGAVAGARRAGPARRSRWRSCGARCRSAARSSSSG